MGSALIMMRPRWPSGDTGLEQVAQFAVKDRGSAFVG